MSARDHLSMPLFHGTTRHVEGKIKPGRKTGIQSGLSNVRNINGSRASDWAFATEDEGTAWDYATTQEWKAQGPEEVRPRGHVYEVGHAPDMQPGLRNSKSEEFYTSGEPDKKEWISKKGFPLGRDVPIRPQGQGTFPGVNWNAYHPKGGHYDFDINHPLWRNVVNRDAMVERQQQAAKRAERAPDPDTTGVVHRGQMDLFSGRTAEFHATRALLDNYGARDIDPADEYHLGNLSGQEQGRAGEKADRMRGR